LCRRGSNSWESPLKDKKKIAAAKKPKIPPPLWDFSRTTAWKHVIAVMKAAGVKGPQATPKGLRHGFGVAAIQAGTPLNLLQRWLGHAQLTTTAIYANAVGPEERNIASRMWT
jgi:integrase